MSGKRNRARKARARRAGRAQQTSALAAGPLNPSPEARPPSLAAGGAQGQVGVGPRGHVTCGQQAPLGHPAEAPPEQDLAAQRPELEAASGSELALVPTQDMDSCGAMGLTPGLGSELLRLHDVQLCLAQEQLLLEDRWRQVQLQMQLWEEQQAWLQQLQEEQAWLQQLQEQQTWVRVEGLELAMALEQLHSQGLEGPHLDSQVSSYDR